MHIEELHLQNFRGFKELTLKFPPDLVVLIGVNGSGKSSILEGISILFAHLLFHVSSLDNRYRNTGNSFPKWLDIDEMKGYPKPELSDMNNKSSETQLSLHTKLEELYINPSLEINSKGESTHNGSLEFLEFIFQKLTLDLDANIPIYIHYTTNRLVSVTSIETPRFELLNFRQLSTYDGCIRSGQNDFTSFFQWFRTQEDIENEERLEVNPEYRDKQLEAVKKAITSILGDDYTNLRVKRTSSQMIVHKNGEELSVNQLSDGEKGLLAMVGDIARRLAIANPSLDNPLEGEGVILIDEIELHLHPQWQRKIIPNLTKTFPNCQFIVSTHSPQVLSNVKKENVFILEDFKLIEHTPHTYGRDSNSILFELMGVSERIPEVQQQIDSCLQLIDDDKLDMAKSELKKLSDLLGEDDAEIVRANTLIDFFHRIE